MLPCARPFQVLSLFVTYEQQSEPNLEFRLVIGTSDVWVGGWRGEWSGFAHVHITERKATPDCVLHATLPFRRDEHRSALSRQLPWFPNFIFGGCAPATVRCFLSPLACVFCFAAYTEPLAVCNLVSPPTRWRAWGSLMRNGSPVAINVRFFSLRACRAPVGEASSSGRRWFDVCDGHESNAAILNIYLLQFRWPQIVVGPVPHIPGPATHPETPRGGIPDPVTHQLGRAPVRQLG